MKLGVKSQDEKITALMDFLEEPKAMREVDLAEKVSIHHLSGVASGNLALLTLCCLAVLWVKQQFD